MSDNVHWVIVFKIDASKKADFEALMHDMVTATKANEPGTLMYEWYVSDDGENYHIYERYANSAAAMIHIQNFGQHFAERVMALSMPTRLEVYGNPGADVRAALDGFGATYYAPAAGFAR